VVESFNKIDYELDHAIDKHSKKLIIANLILFLDYCNRFYDRQFITRDHAHRGVLERFEQLLHDYFDSGKSAQEGLPSVAYCASELHLSANYFGDLIKKKPAKPHRNTFKTRSSICQKKRFLISTNPFIKWRMKWDLNILSILPVYLKKGGNFSSGIQISPFKASSELGYSLVGPHINFMSIPFNSTLYL